MAWAVIQSLANLRTFPCVRILEQKGRLKLHGAFFGVADGRLLVLEFSRVWKPLQKPYDLYSFHVLPWLGGRVAGDSAAYRYRDSD